MCSAVVCLGRLCLPSQRRSERETLEVRDRDDAACEGRDGGVLFSSGLIAGDALLGICVAILISQGLKSPVGALDSSLLGLAVLGAGLLLSFCVPVVLCVQEARQDKNRARFLDTRIAQFVDVPLPNDPDQEAAADALPQ